jgi:general stress protein 26
MKQQPSKPDDRQKIWDLIKDSHSALLVTVGEDSLDSRPMGCLQKKFDDTLWFLTFRHSLKIKELARDARVLVSYARPTDYEYVSLSGRGEIVDDSAKIKELWFEGLRVWFPNGPEDPELALLRVHVDEAKYWTNAASVVTYAWAYVKARLTGERPDPSDIAETKTVRFKARQ